ncbi:MAG: hypothetical protein LBP59_11180 [Planctomycetaceae bacterium]|jgi:hypothetical protein|nr:hypothetical protein [Planctomycetaceae bacterium]
MKEILIPRTTIYRIAQALKKKFRDMCNLNHCGKVQFSGYHAWITTFDHQYIRIDLHNDADNVIVNPFAVSYEDFIRAAGKSGEVVMTFSDDLTEPVTLHFTDNQIEQSIQLCVSEFDCSGYRNSHPIHFEPYKILNPIASARFAEAFLACKDFAEYSDTHMMYEYVHIMDNKMYATNGRRMIAYNNIDVPPYLWALPDYSELRIVDEYERLLDAWQQWRQECTGKYDPKNPTTEEGFTVSPFLLPLWLSPLLDVTQSVTLGTIDQYLVIDLGGYSLYLKSDKIRPVTWKNAFPEITPETSYCDFNATDLTNAIKLLKALPVNPNKTDNGSCDGETLIKLERLENGQFAMTTVWSTMNNYRITFSPETTCGLKPEYSLVVNKKYLLGILSLGIKSIYTNGGVIQFDSDHSVKSFTSLLMPVDRDLHEKIPLPVKYELTTTDVDHLTPVTKRVTKTTELQQQLDAVCNENEILRKQIAELKQQLDAKQDNILYRENEDYKQLVAKLEQQSQSAQAT